MTKVWTVEKHGVKLPKEKIYPHTLFIPTCLGCTEGMKAKCFLFQRVFMAQQKTSFAFLSFPTIYLPIYQELLTLVFIYASYFVQRLSTSCLKNFQHINLLSLTSQKCLHCYNFTCDDEEAHRPLIGYDTKQQVVRPFVSPNKYHTVS